MADDDEIDVLGDFSFNSCFAQNSQGIPSCSNREDTVHPQWLLDSTETNWYDKKSRLKEGSLRKLYGNNTMDNFNKDIHTTWSKVERDTLVAEMAKYGRNFRKISQTLRTRTEAEIQALIEAEYGVNLDTPSFGLDKHAVNEDIPVVQEEIVTDDSNVNSILNIVTTGAPTINVPKIPYKKKNTHSKSLLKSNLGFDDKKSEFVALNPAEILYEDDLILGSTESIGSDLDLTDIVSKNIVKYQAKVKADKKIGNHRRKGSRNYDKGRTRNKSKEVLKSSQGRQRKDSSLSEDSTNSPKMQIVLGSGQALPLSEGEQVIKIDKKKDLDTESDIEIDIDSDNDDNKINSPENAFAKDVQKASDEAPIAVPLRKFEPMPRRQKKINLDGGGGYTIMHTEAGDMYEVSSEPRKERQPRKQPIHLIQCRMYNTEKPGETDIHAQLVAMNSVQDSGRKASMQGALKLFVSLCAPYEVLLHVSTLILMDAHAHTSRGEVMGLVGGEVMGLVGGEVMGLVGGEVMGLVGAEAMGVQGAECRVRVWAYRPAAAAASRTHCDMDPVSQAQAAEALRSGGAAPCGWHHSHPRFAPAPSALDLRSQAALQQALEPCLGLITSQHWAPGRTASQYRCIRVEAGEAPDEPVGYQFSVRLARDLTPQSLPGFLRELRAVRDHAADDALAVRMAVDVCPQAHITYLEKLISSVSHHMRSARYPDDDSVVKQLLQGIRDVFR